MASTEKLLRIVLTMKDDLSGGMKSAASSLDQMGSTLTKAGAALTAFSVPLVAAAAAGVQMAMDLDKSMRNIQSITLQSDESIKALSETFVDMSTDMSLTTDSADNLAKAYYTIISSGVDAADAMDVLKVATKAATAGLTTTETAAQGIVSVLNAYGLAIEDAAYVSNVMFQTVNRGVGSFEELNGALSNVVGMTSALDIPINDLGAALATMSKQGMTFSEASVNLNAALTSMLNPTEAMQKAISDLGYESAQAMVDQLGMAGALQKLRSYAGDSLTTLTQMFGSVRGGRAVLALTGDQFNAFTEDLNAFRQVGGLTQKAFDEQMKSFDASWKNFQNTLAAAGIEIGNLLLPILKDLLDNYIIPLVNWFRGLDDNTKLWIMGIIGTVAALGTLLLVLGQIAGAISAIAGLGTIFAGVGAAAAGMGTAILAALAPIAPIILAIVAVGALLWAVATDFMGVRTAIVNAAKGIGDALSGAWNFISEWAGNISKAWGEMINRAGTAMSQLGQIIWAGLQKLWDMGVQLGGNIIKGLIIGAAQAAIQLIAWVGDLANQIAQTIRNALGIHSPSKVMMKMGEQVVAGFHKGIEGMGGIGVNVNGTSVSGSSPTLASAGTSGGSSGYAGVYINNLNVPPGTSEQQIDYIMREIAKRSQRKGARRGK